MLFLWNFTNTNKTGLTFLLIVEELETKAEEPAEVGFHFFIDWKLYLIYRAISVWSVKQHFVYFQKKKKKSFKYVTLICTIISNKQLFDMKCVSCFQCSDFF